MISFLTDTISDVFIQLKYMRYVLFISIEGVIIVWRYHNRKKIRTNLRKGVDKRRPEVGFRRDCGRKDPPGRCNSRICIRIPAGAGRTFETAILANLA